MTASLDLEHFEHVLVDAVRKLGDDLHRAGVKAAEHGVELAKRSHPYQDHTPVDGLTDSAHVEEDTVMGGGVMTWPADYASYVDEGTSRARAYPYTKKASQLAAVMLNEGVQEALREFSDRLER